MQGKGNHQWLGKKDVDHLFICTSETIYPYKMVKSGKIPAVLMGDPKGVIKGELYHVTDRVMRHLDILESNGRVYQRIQISVKRILGKVPAHAWLYFGIAGVWDNCEVVESGNYRREQVMAYTKGHIENKAGGKSVRLVENETGKPLTGWHRDRTACYDEFAKKRRKEKKDGDRGN